MTGHLVERSTVRRQLASSRPAFEAEDSGIDTVPEEDESAIGTERIPDERGE